MSKKTDYAKIFGQLKKAGKKPSPAHMAEKDKRLVRLVRLMLQLDKGILNLDHAARDCGVSKRTIQRDLNVLEAAGIPLYKPNEGNANYRLEKDFRFFHYHVEEQSAEAFLQLQEALSVLVDEPQKLVSPLQQACLRFAKDERDKKAEQAETAPSAEPADAPCTREQFLALALEGETTREQHFTSWLKVQMFDELITGDYAFAHNRMQLEEWYRTMAHIYRLLGNYAEALAYLNKGLQYNRGDAWCYGEMAFIYYEQKKLPPALRILKKGIQAAKDNEALRFYLAFMLAENKQYEEAIAAFQQVCPYEDAFWAFAAQMHFKAGAFKLALEEIQRAEALSAHKGLYTLYKKKIWAANQPPQEASR